MAMLLAPYNNSMRLGQGFNSFTQQICMNDAVTQGENVPTPYSEEHQSKGISQIVSYSSRFVDKLSDVTDAMNVSASLSIKTGTIGGSVSGTYIDSDKFKTSDLNFFIQVKVTNQTHMARDYTKFQKLNKVPLTKFTEIYGDSFISGWEEGGELNALISVKVSDKSKTTTIKGALEAELGTPALSGAIKGEGGIDKSDINTSTETTISVNWSGGGQIKDPNVIWDINSLTLAAANFPDLVAMTPQRTYAILTKYTALKSFHEQMGFFSPLDYENAGIYTSALLDAYMDYKSIWKQIQIMNWEFESGTTALVKSEPDQELLDYARECATAKKPDTRDIIPEPASDQASEVSEKSWDLGTPMKDNFRPNVLDCEPYNASIVGLNKARRDCRLEMTKIVHEVDAVTDDPTIALQPDRTGIYLSPAIFKQLLPVKTGIKKNNGQRVSPTIEANNEPLPPIHPVSQADRMFAELKASIDRHAHRSEHYQMSKYLGDNVVKPKSVYFNDLDALDNSWIPKSITVFFNDRNIYGVKTMYTDDREILNGEEGMHLYSDTWDLSADEKVQSVRIESHSNAETNGITYIDAFGFSSNTNIVAVTVPKAHENHMRRIVEQAPAGEGWTLRGFYGSFNPSTGMQQLGVVWGNE